MRLAVLAMALLPILAAPSFAAGDATRGKDVFQRCTTCHSLNAGQNGIGPSLRGVFGTKAGSVPGYAFSKAMFATSLVLDEAGLKKFLADPDGTVSGTKMQTGVVDNPQALDDLIAYLSQAAR
jgi:cytochrome c2